MDWLPNTPTIVSVICIGAGTLILLFDGINKQSVITAPLLMYIGAAIYAVYECDYASSILWSLGMIIWGCLMLLARSHVIKPKHHRQKD